MRTRSRSVGRSGTKGASMIRRCNEQDFEQIWIIINDGAQAYQGVIPEDRLSDPYMSKETFFTDQACTLEQKSRNAACVRVQGTSSGSRARYCCMAAESYNSENRFNRIPIAHPSPRAFIFGTYPWIGPSGCGCCVVRRATRYSPAAANNSYLVCRKSGKLNQTF